MGLIHGGDIVGYIEKYGREPRLDLSANTNPLGMPEGVKEAVKQALARADCYPDPLCRRLCQAIAAWEAVPQEDILCGNGAADLIFRLALAARPRRALVTAPTFAEYEQALGLVGCQVKRHTLHLEHSFDVTERFLQDLDDTVDMVFLCNPNNPTGRLVERALLERVLKRCEQTGALLVIDECFMELTGKAEEYTMKGRLGSKNLLLLKAFTKLFAMAGVRLGYCLTENRALLERLRAAGQPWSVSSLAQEAGVAALKEFEYLNKTMIVIEEAKELLLQELGKDSQIDLLGHSANYIFFRSYIDRLEEKMAAEGILIRSCGNYAGLDHTYYRIAIKTRQAAELFLESLRRIEAKA